MNKAYLLIGGNIGDREGFLAAARRGIEERCGTISQQSSLYQTAAWGLTDQEAFLNQAIAVNTLLTPDDLLTAVLSLEESIGRKRELRFGPRTIDIDILFFNGAEVQREGLHIPHPEVQNRRFALVPMAEIAAQLWHPVLHKTIAQLLAECPDSLPVHKIS